MKWSFWTRTHPAVLDDCETIEPLLSLYADGMASPLESQFVERHLPGCAGCRETLAWMQATQRALAARPFVRPPANLRARIADAIAVSSASPVPAPFSTRPARAFALRPAYAAAASLAILGFVGYGLLHQASRNVYRPVTSPPRVAAIPSNTFPASDKPALPEGIIKPSIKAQKHSLVKPAYSESDQIATNSFDKEPAAPSIKVKAPAGVHSAMKTFVKTALLPSPPSKPHLLPTIKKPLAFKTNVALMANTKIPSPPVETHLHPMIQPDNKPQTAVAAVPKPNLPAPAIIEKPIITPDAPTKVAVNPSDIPARDSGLLGSVKAHLGEMRSVALTTGNKSIKGVAFVSHKIDTGGEAYIDAIHTP